MFSYFVYIFCCRHFSLKHCLEKREGKIKMMLWCTCREFDIIWPVCHNIFINSWSLHYVGRCWKLLLSEIILWWGSALVSTTMCISNFYTHIFIVFSALIITYRSRYCDHFGTGEVLIPVMSSWTLQVTLLFPNAIGKYLAFVSHRSYKVGLYSGFQYSDVQSLRNPYTPTPEQQKYFVFLTATTWGYHELIQGSTEQKFQPSSSLRIQCLGFIRKWSLFCF